MSLLLTMLPIYLLGNLHCLGMCGPLVMLLGRHPQRLYYFLGRTVSFSLAGLIAGEMGALLSSILARYAIPALFSLLCGGVIALLGVYTLLNRAYPGYKWLGKKLSKANQRLATLALQEGSLPMFLFGFFTLLLPCGQSAIVFSACAMSGEADIGLLNGFAFALLTSPALLFAMQAHQWIGRLKPHYNKVMGGCALLIGGLSICRGLAELQFLPHLILNPTTAEEFHIVLF